MLPSLVYNSFLLQRSRCEKEKCTFANRYVDQSNPEEVNAVLFPVVEKLLTQNEFRYFRRCSKQMCANGNTKDTCTDAHCIIKNTKTKPAIWEEDSPQSEEMQKSPKKHPLASCPGESIEYVDLIENPQQFTGFSGEEAHETWKKIYGDKDFWEKNCDNPKEAMEIYNSLVSGLQASVSTHIAYSYYYREKKEWGRNIPLYKERVGDHPDRQRNLDLLYTVLLRAFILGTEKIKEASRSESAKNLIEEISTHIGCIYCDSTENKCDKPEHALEKTNLTERDTDAFQQALENAIVTIECVSCEKCRMWGKIQVQGIAAALRLITKKGENIQLLRTETVTFLSVFGRLSESIHIKTVFTEMFEKERGKELRAETKKKTKQTTPTNSAVFSRPSLLVLLSAAMLCLFFRKALFKVFTRLNY
ncbi:MAG: endoplasmic oxidoreductin-1 [Amphiamblys sp. WSBS2006]|nr:MAG: endoplasmic oxidoreductin-1 [Amphiamblys sp. WSBS2006]